MLLSAEYPPQPGGVGDYTRRLGQSLVRHGHAVFVLTIHERRSTIYELSQHPEPTETFERRADWGWGCWESVIAALDRLRPEVLHIQYQTGAYGMHPAINLLPWRLRCLPGRPSVAVTAHDLLPPYLFPKAGPLRRWVTRRLLADADAAILTNAEDYAQVLRGYLKRGSLRGWPPQESVSTLLIPIGSNIPVAPPAAYDRVAWRAALGAGAEDRLIAYFGLIGRSKGLDIVIRALAGLPLSFRLLVVGGAATAPEDRAYAAEIQHLVDQLDLGRRVTITGHCPEAEVSAHLLAADLAALPFADGASFRRGSLLAALAHGLPTITTFPTADHRPPTTDRRGREGERERGRRGEGERGRREEVSPPLGIVPQLIDGDHVVLVPPNDAAALALAIECLAGDAALRDRLGAGGRALAARFSWETIAERHEALYETLRD
jgi:polysaccharide biosynthesis protein PslF